MSLMVNVTQDTKVVGHGANLAQNDPRYSYYVCPRHRPIHCPRYPLLLPPELLIDILFRVASCYLYFLFFSETQDDDEIEERLAANPFPVFLRVSHQYRELAFKVLGDTFGIHRDPDGSLPKDAWACLRYVLKYTHLLQHATPEAVGKHVKQGLRYEIRPILKGYLHVIRMTCTGPNHALSEDAMTELVENETTRRELSGLKASPTLQAPLASLARAVSWSRLFRTSMLPLAESDLPLVPTSHGEKDMITRGFYVHFYVISDLQDTISRLTDQPRRRLVPVEIPFPQAVNVDLINRYKFLSILWRLQSCPILAADQGLMTMTQSMLDSCLAIAMPDRPLTSTTSRRRRASFSALQDIRASPRLPLKPPCHCERRLMVTV